jgi:hypothetical protein
MSRSKRFRVQYITGEANRRYGNNDPSLLSKKKIKIAPETKHQTSLKQKVDRNCWFVECLHCSINLETTMSELELAVDFAERHGQISKVICEPQFDSVIADLIRAIRI